MPTIEIHISEEQLQRLDEKVRARGFDRTTYLDRLIREDLDALPLSQILAPFRKQVEDSGIVDDQLDALFQEAREEAWQQQQGTVQKT